MFLGFSKRLRVWGKYNAHFGIKIDRRRKNAKALLFFLGFLYLYWFMVKWGFIACFWLVYGMCWCIGVSCRAVYRAIKNASARRAVERSAQASPRIEDKEQ